MKKTHLLDDSFGSHSIRSVVKLFEFDCHLFVYIGEDFLSGFHLLLDLVKGSARPNSKLLQLLLQSLQLCINVMQVAPRATT